MWKILRLDDGTVHCVDRVCTAALSRRILGNRWKRSRSTQLSATSLLISLSHVFGLNALTDVVARPDKRAIKTRRSPIDMLPHSCGERVIDSSKNKKTTIQNEELSLYRKSLLEYLKI